MIPSTFTERGVPLVEERSGPTPVSSFDITSLVRSATATNTTPQAMAASAQTVCAF